MSYDCGQPLSTFRALQVLSKTLWSCSYRRQSWMWQRSTESVSERSCWYHLQNRLVTEANSVQNRRRSRIPVPSEQAEPFVPVTISGVCACPGKRRHTDESTRHSDATHTITCIMFSNYVPVHCSKTKQTTMCVCRLYIRLKKIFARCSAEYAFNQKKSTGGMLSGSARNRGGIAAKAPRGLSWPRWLSPRNHERDSTGLHYFLSRVRLR